jgi:hypothetical protein
MYGRDFVGFVYDKRWTKPLSWHVNSKKSCRMNRLPSQRYGASQTAVCAISVFDHPRAAAPHVDPMYWVLREFRIYQQDYTRWHPEENPDELWVRSEHQLYALVCFITTYCTYTVRLVCIWKTYLKSILQTKWIYCVKRY